MSEQLIRIAGSLPEAIGRTVLNKLEGAQVAALDPQENSFYREHAHGDSTDLMRAPAPMGVEERIGFLLNLNGVHRKQWMGLISQVSRHDLESIARALGYHDPIVPSMPANADATRALLFHDFAVAAAGGDQSQIEDFLNRARSPLQRLDQEDVDNQ